MLTDEHIEFIKSDIEKSPIFQQDLKDDLLDHFCCYVESEMQKGLSFQQAYKKAFGEICPDGLGEIQSETIFLLNYTKLMIMKKLTYASGLLFSMVFSLGALFTLLQWQGGNMLFTYGFLGFVFLFVPLFAINKYKLLIHKVMSEKLKVLLGALSAIIIGLSVIFKMLHLQGAVFLLLLGMGLFTFGFLPFLFFRMYKKSVERLA
jgi:hypothetical protein